MPKIMIVDDDPNISLLVKLTLEKNGGFGTVVCPSGEKALKIINEEKPDLVLLDIMMPGMDGYEVCRKIKSSPETKSITVIMLSAKRETKDKVKGMELGADDYIVKPFDPEELMSRIKVHLRIRELEKELIDKKKLETVLAMSVTLQHEINNPLAGILGNAEILSDWQKMEGNDVDECVKVIRQQAKRISGLVSKISKVNKVVESTYLGDVKMIDISDSALQGENGGNG